MPELPEVEGLVAALRDRAVGAVVASVEPASFSVLKTVDPPHDALTGLTVTGVGRHGKFVDLDVDGIHLVIHLAKAGWIRWSDALDAARPRMGGPLALRVRLDRGEGPVCGFDLTEAGTHKGAAAYVVRDPCDVPGVATLGPDALSDDLELPALLDRRMQVKRLLRDQKIVAGIGNAYSDEILHAARLSPFAIAGDLDDEQTTRLATAIRSVLTEALDHARGTDPADLKDAKRTHLRVHGRTGQECPVCGDTVAEVVFSGSSLQYCPRCQTGGVRLKDRSTSRFVR